MTNNIKLDGVEANIDDVLAELRKHGDVTFAPRNGIREFTHSGQTVMVKGIPGKTAMACASGLGADEYTNDYGVSCMIRLLEEARDYMKGKG